ncbi:polysaccharide deacetylase family protein [Leptospira kirschneri]|uniref:Polysaccharide deacetylase n=1 Tax=Leptospira kirschneri str. 200802841 TaxID=1193047 RepID=A0A828YB80_9LEPT|nr:polysaccharide deacetylase family protein [Leptospira kirschneri]EJO67825.1 polysaccharide deacetylase [Leptospira kirschneri serovar Grippotyphosa str. RM52]EKO53668.1 polysaccharide deacetylase [Leptospira kirschneri str. 200802841]EKQ85445.1 polysaccharide deacetylase [Leptospira kirschneri serovar Grippotyphosa str. Moskva]EKR09369.1 polysaccharide deacetylase [Leptospira kirschneri serovar Valbuzzi str. 200702274]EMK02592.1 polysaccharide deacetylase [Leptospira kirschneri str. MMD1493
MQTTTSKIRFNFKTLIFFYLIRNRNCKVSRFPSRVMRNYLFTCVILCILVPSILFSSPVDDFLNPEKKRKTSTTTSSRDTISKKNPQEKKDLDSPPSSKISDQNSKITNPSEQISKDISKSKKKKYEDAIPTVKDDTPPTPSYTIQSESVSGGGVPVLCYHHLAPQGGPMGGYNLHPNLLEEQFKFLKAAGYQTVRLDQFYSYINGKKPSDFPDKPILLTFDDGSKTHWEVLVPLLKKYGFTASIFIYPSIISSGKKYYMTWDQLNNALDSGVLDLGSHTLYHPKLPTMSRALIRKQLLESKQILETKTGRKVIDLAYPFGLFDPRVIEEAKAIGYRMAFTVNPGKNLPGTPVYNIHRSLVPWGQSQSAFNSILTMAPPPKISISIQDGSWVKAGQEFKIHLEGVQPESVTIQIKSKNVISEVQFPDFTVKIPDFSRKSTFLPMMIQAKTKEGKQIQYQYLFINQKEFKKHPDGTF